MHRFLSERLATASNEVRNSFAPDLSSVDAYEASIAPYRTRFLGHLGLARSEGRNEIPTRDSGVALLGPPTAGERPQQQGSTLPQGSTLRQPRVENVGRDDSAEYSRLWIPVADGLELYGLLVVPRDEAQTGRSGSRRGPARKLPLIVAQHGGGGCPEAICGLDDRAAYDDFGRKAVERGYAVFAPFILMTVSYGGDPAPRFDRYAFDQMARLVDLSIVGIEVFKIAEGVRRLVSTHEAIDGSRVAIAGLSYGGFYSLYVAAASRMFACAVVSGILSSRSRDAEHGSYARGLDRLLPGAARRFETQVVGGLVCPRPLMVQHGVADEVVPVEAARAASREISRWYDRLGISDRFVCSEHQGGHRFESDAVLDFIDGHMRRDRDDDSE